MDSLESERVESVDATPVPEPHADPAAIETAPVIGHRNIAEWHGTELIDRVGARLLGDRRRRQECQAAGESADCGRADAEGTRRVHVPPGFMRQVVPSGQRPWAYWHKQGLVIGATQKMVTVTVPKSWRKRAAITWGNGVRLLVRSS
jgi:hypothetical protein